VQKSCHDCDRVNHSDNLLGEFPQSTAVPANQYREAKRLAAFAGRRYQKIMPVKLLDGHSGTVEIVGAGALWDGG
jgi:hypothetical protein